MKRHFLTLSVAVLLLFCGGDRLPAETRQLVVGKAEIDYPPYQFEKDGKVGGICAEIIEQTANRIGLRVVYRKYPWKRLLYYAEKGRIDAVMPLFKTGERQRFLAFPDNELVFEENVLFAQKGSTFQYRGDLTDLRPYRIGVVQGYSYGRQFDQVRDLLDKDVAINDALLVDKFKRGRFQVGIGNRYVVKHYARQLACEEAIRFFTPVVAREPLFIGFSRSKGHEKLAVVFSEGLSAFRKTDVYRELLNKYGFD